MNEMNSIKVSMNSRIVDELCNILSKYADEDEYGVNGMGANLDYKAGRARLNAMYYLEPEKFEEIAEAVRQRKEKDNEADSH